MTAAEHDILRTAEEHHWWYAVLHRLVLSELSRRIPPGAAILDAGCGTGGMMSRLYDWDAQGVDLSPAAITHCQSRGLEKTMQASVSELPFADASFDAVLSLDVLYHRQVDEPAALKEMTRVLKPGGFLLINLPAFNCLRGAHDKAVCGSRRYTVCHVRKKLREHNLNPDMTHYWNAWLFLPLLLWRWWTRFDGAARSDLRSMPAWVNRALTATGHVDARLSRHLALPFGSSVFAVARRSTSPIS